MRFPEVLASGRQLVVLEPREQFLELEEEAFAGCVAVGIHVPFRVEPLRHFGEEPPVFGFQECGGGNGDRLPPRGEHRPAVGAALGDVERFALAEQAQHREIVNAALRPVREPKAGLLLRLLLLPRNVRGILGGTIVEVAVLHSDEPPLLVEVGDLEPVGAVAVLPRGEATPACHPRVYPALLEEEPPCFGREPRVLEEGGVAGRIEGFVPVGRGRGRAQPVGQPFLQDDVVAVGEPPAGLGEVYVQQAHHEVDGAHGGVHADEAPAGVAPGVEGEAGVVVVVEGAECLVAGDTQSEPPGDLLNGQVAESLNFVFFHTFFTFKF